jgi:Bifunctional DNA primase/polymerase, N-terminal
VTLPDEVERLARLGWRLYPGSRKSKAGLFKGFLERATSELDQLAEWARKYPNANWRVVMEGSKIWALDCDAPGPDHEADGIAALRCLIAKHGELPIRPTIRSGGGGLVIVFKHQGEPICGRTGYPLPGLDPRRGRLSVTVPPSIHHRTGKPYEWLIPPWEANPLLAPDWLLQAVALPPEPKTPPAPVIATEGRALCRLKQAIDAIRYAPKGAANSTLNGNSYSVARYVAAGLLSENEAVSALYAAARQRRIPHQEAKDTIRSAFKGGSSKPIEIRR